MDLIPVSLTSWFKLIGHVTIRTTGSFHDVMVWAFVKLGFPFGLGEHYGMVGPYLLFWDSRF